MSWWSWFTGLFSADAGATEKSAADATELSSADAETDPGAPPVEAPDPSHDTEVGAATRTATAFSAMKGPEGDGPTVEEPGLDYSPGIPASEVWTEAVLKPKAGMGTSSSFSSFSPKPDEASSVVEAPAKKPVRSKGPVRGGAAAQLQGLYTPQPAPDARERLILLLGERTGMKKAVEAIEAYSVTNGMNDIEEEVRGFLARPDLSLCADEFSLLTRLENLLGDGGAPYAPTGPLGRLLKAFSAGLSDDDREAWHALFTHGATLKRKPSAKWRKTLQGLVEPLGNAFGPIQAWWEELDLTQFHFNQAGFDPRNEPLAKALVVAATLTSAPGIEAFLAGVAEKCWRKVPGAGAPSKSVGSLAIRELAGIGTDEAVAQLTRLKVALTYNAASKLVDEGLASRATEQSLSPLKLEERSVPSFGLDENGVKRVDVLAWTGEIAVVPGGVELVFVNAKGKRLKTVPKAVREQAPQILKELRAERKSLAGILASQAARIERFWLEDRALPAGVLVERYLEHPVVGAIARRLVWTVAGRTALYQEGALRDLAGEPVPSEGVARLWHPLTADEGEQLLLRDLFESLALSQPFDQLYRSVYRMPVDPERFAGRLLLQTPFLEHCRVHGWTAQRLGTWSGGDTPAFFVEATGADVELNVTAPSHTSDVAGARYLRTETISLHFHGRPVTESADPVLVSEMVRVVDLAVTRCSAGRTAPTDRFFDGSSWTDEAYRPLTALEQCRLQVLERVLPRLALKQTFVIEAPFLKVGETEIHLGSLALRVKGEPATVKVSRKAKTAAGKALLPTEHDPDLVQILGLALDAV